MVNGNFADENETSPSPDMESSPPDATQSLVVWRKRLVGENSSEKIWNFSKIKFVSQKPHSDYKRKNQ
ncbi:hypothetical protein SPHINGOR109_11154 [Sphingorhabdus sp. 109]|jgi:hypothetical protein|nr:hypothetical protein SPHINGOR109_11154 [Sphingorhabdus sp. 109]